MKYQWIMLSKRLNERMFDSHIDMLCTPFINLLYYSAPLCWDNLSFCHTMIQYGIGKLPRTFFFDYVKTNYNVYISYVRWNYVHEWNMMMCNRECYAFTVCSNVSNQGLVLRRVELKPEPVCSRICGPAMWMI